MQSNAPTQACLPETAKWVAAGIQRIILEEELPCIGEQIEVDARAGANVNADAKAFLAKLQDPSADVVTQLAACKVSDETFDGEKHSRLYQETIKKAADFLSGPWASNCGSCQPG